MSASIDLNLGGMYATCRPLQTKLRTTIAAYVQRSCCRTAMVVLGSRPQNTDHRTAASGQAHENSMKQFLNSQDVSMTRTVAADSLRPYCAELLS